MTRPADPPRLAERLLERWIGETPDGQAVLGDLHEEFSRRAARVGRARAQAWYWRHALTLSARLRTRTRTEETPRTQETTGFLLDLRHAARTLRKRPALSFVAALTLALGLGSNAAVFAIVDALVLRPFSFPEVDRIVLVATTSPREAFRQETVAPADFLDWRRSVDAIRHLSALDYWDVNLVGRDEPERIQGYFVSAGFFEALGVRPALGRAFVADDETYGRHRRVVLGHGLWQRRFGADPAIVGRTALIDGTPQEVIGVAPAGFEFPQGSEIWAPLAFDTAAAIERHRTYLTVIGRLAPGRTVDDAQAQMAVVADRLAREHAETNRDRGARVYTLARGMMDVGIGPMLSLWQASGIFVLLIACANIANLLIARGVERRREIAVRLALGASRRRVVRELLAESVLLAVVAVPLAAVMAFVGLRALTGAMPARIARFVAGWQEIDVDARLILYMSALAALTVLLFGLLPALQATRARLAGVLHDTGRGGGAGAGPQRLRRALVVAQVALALPLLVAAGLSAMGTYRFLDGPQGYDPDHLLTMRLVLPEGRYATDDARRQFTARLVDELSRVPDATIVAASNSLPASSPNPARQVEVDGGRDRDPRRSPAVDFKSVTPRFLKAMGIPLLRGRAFSDADREGAARVAIVSRSMGQKFWPGASPVGARVRVLGGEWLTVVGVCGDVIQDWFDRRNAPTLYVPYAQQPAGYMAVVVRTAGDPVLAAPDARAALRRTDEMQPAFDVMPMRAVLKDRTIGLRYIAAVMTAFAAVALVLAVVGVYALMRYLMVHRRHEFGVRMAVGATHADLVRMGVGQAGRLAALGVGVGLALALALGRLIEAGLWGVISSDTRLAAGLAFLLMVSALAAGYLPARRAGRLDPVAALRDEV